MSIFVFKEIKPLTETARITHRRTSTLVFWSQSDRFIKSSKQNQGKCTVFLKPLRHKDIGEKIGSREKRQNPCS